MDPSPPQDIQSFDLPGLILAALPAVAGALFAGASFAMASMSPARRAALRDALEGRKKAALDRYIRHSNAIESRWLALRVLGISVSAVLIAQALPPNLGPISALIAALCALLAYGVPAEILRALVLQTAERSAPLLLGALRPMELLVAPLAAPAVWLGKLASRLVQKSLPQAGVTENEVELIVTEGELNGSLDHEQSEMIRNVLEFGDLTAGEIMVPRTRIVSFDIQTSGEDVLRTVAETEHSRYPIFRERGDNIVGILHVKDVVTFLAKSDVKTLKLADIVRTPVTFVPESQLASSVLKCMRAERHHMAIVLDEFGGIAGLVTLEDLIEEIVGDIRDEHDVEEPPIVDLGDGRLMVDAGVSMVDLGRYLGRALPDDGDYNSLGGFLVARLGRVPAAGVKLRAFDLDFVVREADERHIARVEIVRRPDQVASVSTRPSSMSAA